MEESAIVTVPAIPVHGEELARTRARTSWSEMIIKI